TVTESKEARSVACRVCSSRRIWGVFSTRTAHSTRAVHKRESRGSFCSGTWACSSRGGIRRTVHRNGRHGSALPDVARTTQHETAAPERLHPSRIRGDAPASCAGGVAVGGWRRGARRLVGGRAPR